MESKYTSFQIQFIRFLPTVGMTTITSKKEGNIRAAKPPLYSPKPKRTPSFRP